MNRFVPTLLRADCPGAAGVLRQRRGRIVFSLPLHAPNRMDWRQIQNIESHSRDVSQSIDAIPKSPVVLGIGGARTRKHFVPTAESRPLPIHYDLQFLVVLRIAAAFSVPIDQRPE